MKVNHKILSLPPYVSTTWKNVASLHVELRNGFPLLIVVLLNGQRIEIPNLDAPVIEAIFHAHERYMEQEIAKSASLENSDPIAGLIPEQIRFSFPLKIAMGGLDSLGSLLQHNPGQANTPLLPPEVLEKIAFLSKSAGMDENMLSESEPHCNCMHCQISRAIHGELETIKYNESAEEIVTDEDLTFRTWDIKKTGDQLYTVSNPLDPNEQYNVFLGNPVGCTCGTKSCEHLLAVLKS